MVVNQLHTYPANTGLESGALLALYVIYISTIVVCVKKTFLKGTSVFLFIKSFFWNLCLKVLIFWFFFNIPKPPVKVKVSSPSKHKGFLSIIRV